MEDPKNIGPIATSVPLMSAKRFAELTGFELGVIRGWLDKKYLPSIKVGAHRAVNVALLNQEALSQPWESATNE